MVLNDFDSNQLSKCSFPNKFKQILKKCRTENMNELNRTYKIAFDVIQSLGKLNVAAN